LVAVTAVTRVLPRQWDGLRLLRFLTGLAMLALAFTVHATPPAPAPPAAAIASASPAASAPAAASTTPASVVAEPVAAPPARPVATPAVISTAFRLLVVGAFAFSVRAERAPPLA
jgi:hypothetical protein